MFKKKCLRLTHIVYSCSDAQVVLAWTYGLLTLKVSCVVMRDRGWLLWHWFDVSPQHSEAPEIRFKGSIFLLYTSRAFS